VLRRDLAQSCLKRFEPNFLGLESLERTKQSFETFCRSGFSRMDEESQEEIRELKGRYRALNNQPPL
jgi:hypothetical protein